MDGLGLLFDAKAAGLTVETVGDNLRIRGPKKAEPIVRRLEKHKAAVMKVLRVQEQPPPPSWNPETQSLVKWFLELGQHRILANPFRLAPWIEVVDPAQFKEFLNHQISLGPDWITNRNGKLHEDLRMLRDRIMDLNKENER